MLGSPLRRLAWLAPTALAVTLALLAGGQPLVADGAQRSSRPSDEVPTGHIVVQGRIMYIDRNSDRSHPAAGLRVEIWDQDYRSVSPGEKLGETVTDANGFFVSQEISNYDPDGPTNRPEGTQDVFLKLFTNNGNVRVLKAGTPLEYSWPSYDIDPQDGLERNVPDGVVGMKTLYVMESTSDVEALWTFVNLVEGWLHLEATTGLEPGPVTAYWSPTASDGPRYDVGERAIYFRDADAAFASVVVQQEAYALLHNAYGASIEPLEDCTVGPTAGLQSETSAACAFVQGLATFYPLAVYGDPVFASLDIRGVDLDEATAGTAGWQDGDNVPGRIAGAFWDLHEGDTTEETFDRYDATLASIWHALAEHQPTTMAEWWSAWTASGGDGCSALGSLFQNTIDYNTAPQISPLGELTLDEDTELAVDLAQFVSDAECPTDRLDYSLGEAGDPRAGVKLVPTGVISITPELNWFGETDINLAVSDGPAVTTQPVHVVVNPVNDCPEVKPNVQDVQVRLGEPIILNLLPFGQDVEDEPYQLAWDAELESQDEKYVTVEGAGTTTLTFRLSRQIVDRRNVRVMLIVRDRDGCEGQQPVALTWTSRPNNPPWIWQDRLTREYSALVNTKIDIDLQGVADDDEDGMEPLEWFVVNSDDLNAQVGYVGGNRQILQFDPEVNFVGHNRVELEVRDTDGAGVSTAITLTWQSRNQQNNLPPVILRNRLLPKTVGVNATACYPLLDKAVDPDDPLPSLAWFVTGFEADDLQVMGQGTHELCLRARANYEGCLFTRFIVRDPKGAEDAHGLRTCWRSIELYLPVTIQSRR